MIKAYMAGENGPYTKEYTLQLHTIVFSAVT